MLLSPRGKKLKKLLGKAISRRSAKGRQEAADTLGATASGVNSTSGSSHHLAREEDMDDAFVFRVISY